MLTGIITLCVLLVVTIIVIKLLFEYGGVILKIIFHLIIGWISLAIVNIIPGINVPINILTMIISGFGGILGTILLVLLSLIF